MNIILSILILGAIILIHELGHFLMAKVCGIGVVEFSLGMGPRLFSVEMGETKYSIKAFPFGGSCAMLGEDEEADEGAPLEINRSGPELPSWPEALYLILYWHFFWQ